MLGYVWDLVKRFGLWALSMVGSVEFEGAMQGGAAFVGLIAAIAAYRYYKAAERAKITEALLNEAKLKKLSGRKFKK